MVERFECRSRTCGFAEDYPNEDSPVECPACGSKWYCLRFITKPRIKSKPVSIGYSNYHRYSATLGVSETQIEEAKKLHPQAEWKRFGHSFRPLIKNRAEKKMMMKQANYEEFSPKDFKGKD